jgi:hypothetical protein
MLLLAVAGASHWTSGLLAGAARLPGGAGEWCGRRLAERESEPATERALLLLDDDGVGGDARLEVARGLLRRRERRAIPHVIRALSGPDASFAAQCSQLLADFAGAGPSFAPEDPPERRAEVVRVWNLWWRRMDAPSLAPSASPPLAATAAGEGPGATRTSP